MNEFAVLSKQTPRSESHWGGKTSECVRVAGRFSSWAGALARQLIPSEYVLRQEEAVLIGKKWCSEALKREMAGETDNWRLWFIVRGRLWGCMYLPEEVCDTVQRLWKIGVSLVADKGWRGDTVPLQVFCVLWSVRTETAEEGLQKMVHGGGNGKCLKSGVQDWGQHLKWRETWTNYMDIFCTVLLHVVN